jgi:hypothetical protein
MKIKKFFERNLLILIMVSNSIEMKIKFLICIHLLITNLIIILLANFFK